MHDFSNSNDSYSSIPTNTYLSLKYFKHYGRYGSDKFWNIVVFKNLFLYSMARFIFSKSNDYVEQVTTGCGIMWEGGKISLKTENI